MVLIGFRFCFRNLLVSNLNLRSFAPKLFRESFPRCYRLLAAFLCSLTFAGQLGAEELDAAKRLALDPANSIAVEEASSRRNAVLRSDVEFLSGDALKGRGVGSEGLDQAAEHIAASFAKNGLRVDSFAGNPFQTLDVNVSATMGPADKNRLKFLPITPSVNGAAEANANVVNNIEVELDRTFRPLAIGDSAAIDAEIVFVGYGITAPEYGYDDYANVDVQGRVVMLIRKEPTSSPADGKFDGPKNSQHAYFETKLKNAAKHGAVGVLLINDRDSIRDAQTSIDSRIADETRRMKKVDEQLAQLPEEAIHNRETLQQRRGTINAMLEDLNRQRTLAEEGLMEIGEAGEKSMAKGLPVLSLSRQIANRLLLAADSESVDLIQEKINRTMLPSSRLFRHRASLETSLNSSTVPSSNVVGVLDGKGALAEQTVIVGAHYDHVGMGGFGSLAPGTIAVHNGADDNASGTAVLLSSVSSIQERLAESTSHRRVVFIAFTGEERGLLGSEYYVRNPRFPLESTVAMINLDMVGRLRDNDLTVYGTGTAVEMDEIVEAANRATGFKLFKVPSGYGPSDHQSFYTKNIPVLFFFTGLHNDYHRPSDDFDKINFIGLTRITDITSGVAIDLALRQERPQYAATNRDVSIRWQATAHLGIQLRETDDGGVIITAVTPGGSAEAAGMLAGDRLQKFDDREIRTIGEVLETIGSREVGEPLRIELQRDESVLTLTAILKNRPG